MGTAGAASVAGATALSFFCRLADMVEVATKG
jgi:hypothetical protein